MFCVRYVVQQYYELEKRSNGNARYHNFMFWGRNVKLCGLHFYFFFFFYFFNKSGLCKSTDSQVWLMHGCRKHQRRIGV